VLHRKDRGCVRSARHCRVSRVSHGGGGGGCCASGRAGAPTGCCRVAFLELTRCTLSKQVGELAAELVSFDLPLPRFHVVDRIVLLLLLLLEFE